MERGGDDGGELKQEDEARSIRQLTFFLDENRRLALEGDLESLFFFIFDGDRRVPDDDRHVSATVDIDEGLQPYAPYLELSLVLADDVQRFALSSVDKRKRKRFVLADLLTTERRRLLTKAQLGRFRQHHYSTNSNQHQQQQPKRFAFHFTPPLQQNEPEPWPPFFFGEVHRSCLESSLS